MEIYIKQENNPSQVEITKDDISEDWPDLNDVNEFKIPINDLEKLSSLNQEYDKEKEQSEINDCVRIKTEPLDCRDYENESNLKHCDWIETENLDIKPDVKKEIGTNLENLECDNIHNCGNTWTNIQDNGLQEYTANVKQETDEFSELSDSSDSFTEPCIKSEDGTLEENSDSDDFSFNRQRNSLTVKEAHVENVCSKSEATGSTVKEASDDSCPLYKCDMCEFKTLHKRSLKLHLDLHEDPNKLSWYKCRECNYKTRQKGHLNRHFLIHQNLEEREMFICAICDFKFKQKCTLRRHIKDVHIAPRMKKEAHSLLYDQIYHCNDCSYSTTRRGLFVFHLDKHKNVQDVSGLYVCDICSFSTKYKRNLRAHMRTHKKCPELEVYVCNICKFKTKSGYSLRRHNVSKGHLRKVGKLQEYCPRYLKLKKEKGLY